MASKRSKRLELIVHLAQAAESEAARELGDAQNTLEDEHRRLADITDYYNSYQDQFSRNTHKIRSSDLANSRAFLSNLNQARQAQLVQIQHAEQNVLLAKQKWRESHLKCESLDSYQSRVAKEERAITEKKDQRMLDDLINQRRKN